MKIPETVDEFKRLPRGTELYLIRNIRGVINAGVRKIIGLTDNGETMRFVTPNREDYWYLPLTGEFFYTKSTFGFKENGKIAVEYKFYKEGE